MDYKLPYDKGFLNGYAFLDEMGFCIIIVYGENKRDLLIKHYASVV